MWEGQFILFLIQVTFTFVEAPGGGGKAKSDFGYSKEQQFGNPDFFWPISSSLHGNSAPTSSLTAILHQATLDAGETDLNSVNFDGTSQSFMTIPNDGALDGTIAFCWIFKLYPAKDQTATILEYGGLGGTGNGVRLSQQGTFLVVTLYDSAGTFVTDYQQDVLTLNSWNFVGFSYNNDWGHVDIIEDSSLTYLDISQTDLLVNAVGDVTIGNSPDGSMPFEGKVSCIQFYAKALFNNALNNPPSYCSLAQWTDMSILDWTETSVPTTTFSTTIPSTTDPTTATESTTTATTTTTTTDTSTTTPEVSTTETIGSSSPSTTKRPATTGDQKRFPRDVCFSFNHLSTRQNIPLSYVISMTSQSTVTNCAQRCTSFVGCVTFSYSSVTKDCRLSNVTSPAVETSLDESLRIYKLNKVDW